MEPPAEPPPEVSRPSPAEPEPYHCHRCGAPHDPFQEYCLECGARLVPLQRGSWSIWRREAWGRESPMWFWATFLALLLIALAAAAIVLAATSDDDDDRRRPRGAAPTGPTISTVGPPTQTGTITTGTLPETFTFPPPTTGTTVPTFTSTVGDGTTGTTTGATTGTTPTTTGRSTTVIAWPSGRRGYTVVLASYPRSRGRAVAEDKAEEAIADGLRDVGVLDSSNFASLRTGYYVVFYGVHDTESQAVSARANARREGYANAYVREVNPG